MKTITTILIGALILLIGFEVGLRFQNANYGSSDNANQNYYLTATSTSIACDGSTSTLILGAASGQGQRFDFEVVNASGTTVTLCKSASGCISGKGVILASSTGSYKQNDAYYGAYSCNGGGTTSTVGAIFSQN